MYFDYLHNLTDKLKKFTVPRNLFVKPYIDPRKKELALDSYAHKLEDVPDSVWFLYDSTVLGRAQTGFVITSDLNIYGRRSSGEKRFQVSLINSSITVSKEEQGHEQETEYGVLYCDEQVILRTSLNECLWLEALFNSLQIQSLDLSASIFQNYQGRNVEQTRGCGCLVLFAFVSLSGMAPTIMNAMV